ncbi:unnamed protein product [Dibothriocephalus latus]|uniref:Uncharacterized protein n=1 Tax=Dibothriocephalus latus TaxID=60516 RepID=A0A3P7LJN6_DIBLA|nr:unnamed protein product [Dibothriocephalus latus]
MGSSQNTQRQATAETLAIRLTKPSLCCQKTLVAAFCLLWPTRRVNTVPPEQMSPDRENTSPPSLLLAEPNILNWPAPARMRLEDNTMAKYPTPPSYPENHLSTTHN